MVDDNPVSIIDVWIWDRRVLACGGHCLSWRSRLRLITSSWWLLFSSFTLYSSQFFSGHPKDSRGACNRSQQTLWTDLQLTAWFYCVSFCHRWIFLREILLSLSACLSPIFYSRKACYKLTTIFIRLFSYNSALRTHPNFWNQSESFCCLAIPSRPVQNRIILFPIASLAID